MTTAIRVMEALEAVGRAPSILKVKEEFRRLADGYGYSAFMCTDPPFAHAYSRGAILFDEWPTAWRRRYVQNKYAHRDPMVLELHRTVQPFTWTDVIARRTHPKRDWNIVFEASEWGMRQGFVVPIHLTGGRVHAVTMAGVDPRVDLQARAELHLLAMYAHARALHLKKNEPEEPLNLTSRQREVLQLVAAGKTDWEIGRILKISGNGVHKVVERIKQRIGVSTRMQAVLHAIRRGEIAL